MIKIDVLSKEDNNIQLNGEYSTVAYEIAKAIATYLVVYINSKDEVARQSVINYLFNVSLKMLPEVEQQIKDTGVFTKMPKDFLNKIIESED